ncbi:MAG: TetR/AcrR family transcriptional regulator [Bacteroidetes bacterium]|nr:TetR/AcrR family transcriptional regulator [Bacteroidota bacterium]
MDNTIQQLSRKERERLFKRQEIIQAAREVFSLRGFTSATLDEIAEKAEFGKGTLYSYFQSKDELFDTVLADMFEEFVSIAAEACSDPEKEIEESYTDFARALLRHLFENYGMYYLLIREMHKMEHQSHFATLFPNLLLIIAEPLKRNLPAENLKENAAEQLGFMFLTLILSLFRSSLHILGQRHCYEQATTLDLSSDEIQHQIDHNIALLRQVYFNGVLSMKKTGNSRHT